MIDVSQPNSPGWWFKQLGDDLAARQADLDLLDAYYCGQPPLPEGASGAREAYQRFQQKARANYAKLVVEAVRQKMTVTGFRTGSSGDEQTDALAWRIWQANQLDADSSLLFRSSLVMRDGYAIVAPGPDMPVITPEDPRQVITAHDPIQRRKVIAALKVYTDPLSKLDVAYLYLPGKVYRAAKPANGVQGFTVDGWEWVPSTQAAPNPQPLPAGLEDVVPVVRFSNDPDLKGHSAGEFEHFLDVLDRINHMILQRMVIATLQAFRQRAVKGDLPTHYPPDHPQAGEVIDYNGIFTADPGALWLLPEGAEMWESGQVDLTPILSSVTADVKELAAVTQTPLYMLSSDAVNQSAEGASLVREGHKAKVLDRRVNASESLEQMIGLAFRFLGQPVPDDMETLWEPVESYSLSERAAAAQQATLAGVPWETVMSDVMGFSPQQVKRMVSQRAEDALLAPALTQVNAPAG